MYQGAPGHRASSLFPALLDGPLYRLMSVQAAVFATPMVEQMAQLAHSSQVRALATFLAVAKM
jgi:hypothetical protein